MPRKPRFNLAGVPQHVIQRGNNRDACFFTAQDYSRYLDILKESADKFHCRIHAYVLMTNHVHLLVTPMKEFAVSQMMQALGRRYVGYVNKTQQRTGTLWEGRFKACLIDSEHYLLACMRYIELNSVRANMVEHPGEYLWSSYQANAQNKSNNYIEPHPVYIELGASEKTRQLAYRDLFRTHMNSASIDDIRDALNHELVLGRSYFKDKIKEMTDRQTRLGKAGRPRVEDEVACYKAAYIRILEAIAL